MQSSACGNATSLRAVVSLKALSRGLISISLSQGTDSWNGAAMKPMLGAWVLWVGVYLLSSFSALAESRVALVIGNGSYAAADPLKNAIEDADLMARTLEGLGFKVVLLHDSDNAAMSRAVADFGRALREAGAEATGLFFYAGHAVQSRERNYLLPVDAAVQNAADLELVAVDAETVLRQMASARNKVNVFILNANRASAFAAMPDLAAPGLAQMAGPDGTFLAFAASPGTVAQEGEGANSPYARALAALMISQGMPIDRVFAEVRVAVEQLTSGAQSPWEYSALTEAFYFAAPVSSPDEDALWEAVKASDNPLEIQMFIESYPGSMRRAEAEALLLAAQERANAAEAAAAAEAEAEAAADVPGEMPKAMQAAIAAAPVAFQSPIAEGTPEIIGKTIEELIVSQPMYPPIEGLPDEAWKGLKCSNCHQWEKANLCEQGEFYVNETTFEAAEKQHPLGGAFKLTLRRWAELGCP
jgi:uncharacterized caspase-like protein